MSGGGAMGAITGAPGRALAACAARPEQRCERVRSRLLLFQYSSWYYSATVPRLRMCIQIYLNVGNSKKHQKSARRVRRRLRAGWGRISRTPSPIPAAPHPPKRARSARAAREARCAAHARRSSEPGGADLFSRINPCKPQETKTKKSKSPQSIQAENNFHAC